ncbi:FAD-dependent oxidoreductase [Stenotrophomonas sepilia]|uniref:FAD-dependent oxidoreductase n=1 Tax=Stenotrophomonas sepilia TaxID=2860290 RepID=UPI002E7A1701|nr:FAD-dependent monooxygenase [Stenotrophomonas sepilia]
MSRIHVSIIGAGLGGLALAQALKRGGVAFDVFEADRTLNSRPQGYRIRIDAEGQRALARTLPPELYDLFRGTVSTTATSGRFLTPGLLPAPGRKPDSWRSTDSKDDGAQGGGDVSVNRRTLREILMCGIEDRVHFDRAFDRYALTSDGRAEVRFRSGGPASTCDVLVGADGVNSRVRSQLAPDAQPVDTGAVCIYGKVDLDRLGGNPSRLEGTTIVFADGFAAIFDQMQFDRHFLEHACAHLGCSVTPTPDYLYWCLIGPAHRFGVASDHRSDPDHIRKAIVAATDDWHPDLREILQQSKVADTAMLPIRSGRPDVPWPVGPATLLGDAVHAMTPAGGLGANTALADAAALAELMLKADSGALSIPSALAQYQSDMRERARHAVDISNRGADRLFGPAVPEHCQSAR